MVFVTCEEATFFAPYKEHHPTAAISSVRTPRQVYFPLVLQSDGC